MNDEIQRIISGESKVRYGTNIQATIDYLRKSEKTSALDKTDKHFKREETERLKQYVDNQTLWVKDIVLHLPKHNYSNQYLLPKEFDYQYIVSVSLFLLF
jgi:hypothetical protein